MAERLVRIAASVLILFAISACGDSNLPKIEQYLVSVAARIDNLATSLDEGKIRNATLLAEYARLLAEQQPDLAPLANQLALDSTSSGPLFKSIVQRYNDAKTKSAMFANSDERLAELENLSEATDVATFGDMLSDPINVIADLSQGQLARVNAISKEQSLLANQADDLGPGAQLIGNPAYGQWQTNSSGMSFWAWYGMYSMFDNIFNRRYGYGRTIGYNDWYSRRDYSYYNDYGRYRYSSPNQFKKQNRFEESAKKTFANDSRFTSRYSKNRTGGSKLSAGSQKAQTATTRFKSTNFAKKSAFSRNASFRDSRSNTSRGIRRGK